MKEIGGYIEINTYGLPMLYENLIALNCGRNALAYLVEARKIRKIKLPYYLCDSVSGALKKYDVVVDYYHIQKNFYPIIIDLKEDEWLYVVNYYGQLNKKYILQLKEKYKRVIVDNAQAYFDYPVEGVDTIYTCRKFFGVADGAMLATDARLDRDLPKDESFERMNFLLGRYERKASDFYAEYVKNNEFFKDQPIKRMSRLTRNFLHGINYEEDKKRRTENFEYLHSRLGKINELNLNVSEGAFTYPLLVGNGKELRKKLIEKQIYIPILWPSVCEMVPEESIEYRYASDILPLPCDQRYNNNDMDYICTMIERLKGVK